MMRSAFLAGKTSSRMPLQDETAPLEMLVVLFANGAPGRIRTCGPKLRRLVLYPTELRARDRLQIARNVRQRNLLLTTR